MKKLFLLMVSAGTALVGMAQQKNMYFGINNLPTTGMKPCPLVMGGLGAVIFGRPETELIQPGQVVVPIIKK